MTAGYTAGAFDRGDLTVRLARGAGGSNGRWLGFDNVTLVAAPVPEASTFAMFGAGLAGLVLAAGRRRRQGDGTRPSVQG
ncbi:PEP-CTERM sorting domain-containing protein [Aquincola sp. MAHUQ-54]|uniref:PEP-CTERM sorting domain-containing protein n=1 Tax=Aquincola agrisoli TaxID=3119538 RepID=A0AAW9Q7B1_9BURK